MTPLTATLAYRKRGSTTWVGIDPASTTGRRYLAALGLTIDPTEDEMTAATAATTGTPALRVVPDTKTNMGLLLRARLMARRATDALLAAPRAAWGWLQRTLHLDALGQSAGGLLGWIRTKATSAWNLLGINGALGGGMLALSTHTGHQLIGQAWRPVAWGFRMLDKGWLWAAEKIGNLGAPGEWVAHRMIDLEEFIAGNGGTSARSAGLIGTVVDFYNAHVAMWLNPDNAVMAIVRAAGTLMLASPVLTVAAMLPLGWFGTHFVRAVNLGMGGVVVRHGWTGLTGIYRMVRALFTGRDAEGKFTSVTAEATADAAHTATSGATPPAPAKATQSSAAAGNRAAKRAQARKAGRPAARTA